MIKRQDRATRGSRNQRAQDDYVIEELSGDWSRGRVDGSRNHRTLHRSEIEDGETVQDHIRRAWTSKKGGLPVF